MTPGADLGGPKYPWWGRTLAPPGKYDKQINWFVRRGGDEVWKTKRKSCVPRGMPILPINMTD